jgi:hypothetical protein
MAPKGKDQPKEKKTNVDKVRNHARTILPVH